MEPQGQRSFSLLLEKGLASKVKLGQWCSTMDIVALVTEDGQLQLFRLNWQRLWALSPDSTITSIQWSPDGKHLAYGDENGTVCITSPEDGSVVEKRKVFEEGSVIGLAWSTCNNAAPNPHLGAPQGYRAPRLLHSDTLSEIFKIQSSNSKAPYDNKVLKQSVDAIRRPGKLSLLTAVSSKGETVVCGEGLYNLMMFNAIQDSGDIVDVTVQMAPSIKELAILTRSKQGYMKLVAINTSVLAEQAALLHTLGALIADTMRDISMVYDVMKTVRGSIEVVLKTRQDYFDRLRDNLMEDKFPEKAVYDLLIRGYYCMELKSFVGNNSMLKETIKKIDTGMAEAYSAVVLHLQPCLERIAFRLGEMRGHSQCIPARKHLGLQMQDIGKCERRLLNIIAICEHFREVLLKAASSYRLLFSLFTTLSRIESGEHVPPFSKIEVDQIVEFLTDGFHSTTIEEIMQAISCPSEKQDQELLACMFRSQVNVNEHGNASLTKNRYDIESGIDEQEMADMLVKRVQMWLQGSTSADVLQDLVKGTIEDSSSQGIYGIDCVKAEFLCACTRISEYLSKVSTVIYELPIMQEGESDCAEMDMAYGQDDTLYLVASGSKQGIFYYKITGDMEQKQVQLAKSVCPVGISIRAVRLYKDNSAIMATSSEMFSSIVIIPQDEWKFEEPISMQQGHTFEPEAMPSFPMEGTALRIRQLEESTIFAPFVIGAARGVALTVVQPQRIALFDLEEDEDEDEELM